MTWTSLTGYRRGIEGGRGVGGGGVHGVVSLQRQERGAETTWRTYNVVDAQRGERTTWYGTDVGFTQHEA